MMRHNRLFWAISSLLVLLAWPALAQSETALADLYDRTNTAVVGVRAVSVSNDPFAPQGGGVQGAGFFFDGNGNIVTTAQLVADASRIEVSLPDGTLAQGTLVGADPVSNIAVVRVDVPQELSAAISVVDAASVRVGQPVVALGLEFGERATLTQGVVRDANRRSDDFGSFDLGRVIQTDAEIGQPENGGPLLNLSSEVIGLNVLEANGMSYAIPGGVVRSVAQQLIDSGSVAYSFLGITASNVALPIIETFGLPDGFRGAVVNEVLTGTPASRGGLRAAVYATGPDGLITPQSMDIITAVDGVIITGVDDLFLYLALNTAPEQTIQLTIRRIAGPTSQETRQLDVTLGTRPQA